MVVEVFSCFLMMALREDDLSFLLTRASVLLVLWASATNLERLSWVTKESLSLAFGFWLLLLTVLVSAIITRFLRHVICKIIKIL